MLNKILKYIHKTLTKFENTKNFKYEEAWKLFKIIATAEAVGWTLLISGVLINSTQLPLHVYALPIFGQIHGIIFICYFIILLAIYPSLNWNRTTLVFGIISGILPYGSLVFEINRIIHNKDNLNNNLIIATVVIKDYHHQLLAQPTKEINWELPKLEINNIKINKSTNFISNKQKIKDALNAKINKIYRLNINVIKINFKITKKEVLVEILCTNLNNCVLTNWNLVFNNYDDFMLKIF